MTRDDTSLTGSSGNVFADLGFAEPEASVHKMRSELMIAIDEMIEGKLVDGSGHQRQR
jgi:predicted XRE-type DNA-binding protein